MRIAVLGPLEVQGDDAAPIAVPGAKERLLLAVLAAGAPATVSADRIVESLWDGQPPETARKSLQAHVVRLRSALEPDRPKGSSGRYVLRRGAGYALAVEREDLDALQVGDLVARGRASLATEDPVEAERLLARAVALWRGDPYGDWPDAPFADAERQRLAEVLAAGTAALLEARLGSGRHAEVLPELRRLTVEQPLHEEWWRLLMLALYRDGRQGEALAAGRRIRTLLAEELGVDPGPALRETEAGILAQDPGLTTAGPVLERPPAPGTCPYKGLAAYLPGDARLFHGRTRLVTSWVGRLVDTRLLVVSGPSGAGKSSVVGAGLVPALGAGALPGSGTWQPVVVSLRPRPVDLLAGLTGLPPPKEPVLLVCDQAEQLWAAEVSAAERTAFLDTVLGLLDDGVVARCVVVIRGDHLGRLAEHAPLAERLEGAIALVPPFTEAELREAVQEPAAAVGLSVEADLMDAVVADVLGRAGALPLLSTALVGTWERRDGNRLTLAGYLAAGGVTAALTRSAEAAYAALDEAGRAEARRLLLRLADADETGALVRRAVPLDELDLAGEGGDRRRAVVEAFVGRRLLVVDGGRVEVAHEALLSAWARLAHWLEEDAIGRALRRHLAPAARDWAAGGRPTDELYRGARLSAALDWLAGPDALPTALEREFLETSQARADADLREARTQVDRERRGRRRTRRLAIGLAAVLVISVVVAVQAARFQRAANERADQIQSSALRNDAARLAALSSTESAVDLSLLLAAQAVALRDLPETEDALLGSLLSHQHAVRTLTSDEEFGPMIPGARGTVFVSSASSAFTWSPMTGAQDSLAPQSTGPTAPEGLFQVADVSPRDGGIAAAGFDQDDRISVWLLDSAGHLRTVAPSGDIDGQPLAIAYTADGGLLHLVVANASGWRVVELDVTTGVHRDTGIGGPSAASLPGALLSDVEADIAPDGRTAVVSEGDSATLVDLADGRQTVIATPARAVPSNGFRALSGGAAQLWADGAVTRYDGDGQLVQQFGGGGRSVLDLVPAPDGSWAATVDAGGGIAIWDVDPGTGQWTARSTFQGHAGEAVQAEITDDGLLVTRGTDNRLVAWDVRPGAGFGASIGAGGERWLAGPLEVVRPGQVLVAPTRALDSGPGEVLSPATADLAATFFDPRDGRELASIPVGTIEDTGLGGAPLLAVSPDRTRVAVSTGLTTTVLDADTRKPSKPIELPPVGSRNTGGQLLRAGLVTCLGWSPDSARLLLCVDKNSSRGSESFMEVVSPTTGEVGREVPLQGVEGTAIALDPDRKALLVVGSGVGLVLDRSLRIERVVTLTDAVGGPHDAAFSADGKRIAVIAEQGRTLDVIHTADWSVVSEPLLPGSPYLQVQWLDDDRTVALSSASGTVSLFDTERRRLRVPPLDVSTDPGAAPVHLVTVGGDVVVALSGERPGRRWSMDPTDWVEQACAVAGRTFTREEWAQYLPDRPYRPVCAK
jgi:DNA-binding SARP family transcriptional activator/WD40 repeat protein